jgi:hypothetical protein
MRTDSRSVMDDCPYSSDMPRDLTCNTVSTLADLTPGVDRSDCSGDDYCSCDHHNHGYSNADESVQNIKHFSSLRNNRYVS